LGQSSGGPILNQINSKLQPGRTKQQRRTYRELAMKLGAMQHSTAHRRHAVKPKRFLCVATACLLAAISAQAWPFGPKGDSNAEKKANIRKQRDEMLAQLYAANPDMKKVLKKATGYATFKQVNVNLLLLATGNGYGVVVDNKTKKETFMRMGSLGGGIGAGVKDVRAIFVFHDAKVMKTFVEEGWQFGGQADAAAKYENTGASAEQNVKGNVSFHEGTVAAGSSTDLRAGTQKDNATSAAVATRGGMEVYQFTESGVALQATVSGTKYWKDSKLNQ
jgi:lipid-binding SYLF domain-containing protein